MTGTPTATRVRAPTHARRRLVEEAARNLAHAAASDAIEPGNDAGYLLRQGLFDEQLRALDDRSRVKGVMCPRRSGKTHVFAAMLLDCARHPGKLALYLTITRRNAKLIIWRILKRMALQAGIVFVANETELAITVAGGGTILLGGADDIAEIEKWRGHAYDLVIVDECGSFPPLLLQQLRDDVIEPATADRLGQQVYGGTPGKVLDGPWWEMSGPAANGSVYVHTWTAKENTAVPGLWEEILRIKADRGWGDDHPTWIREYLGMWVQDSSTLVYPFDLEINAIGGLPTHTITGVRLNPSGWRYVLGVDVGYVDETAFVLGCCHEDDPRDFIVRSEGHEGMLPDQVAEYIRTQYLASIPGCRIVIDAGGMGKIHAETIRRRFRLPVEAAIKTEKADAIRDMRGRLMAGRLMVLDGAQNDAIRGEWSQLGWDDKREQHAKGQKDHRSDAALYMLRALHNYRQDAAEPVLEQTPAEVAAQLRENYKRRHMPKQSPWGAYG